MIVCCILTVSLIFKFDNGMLYSAFIIDFIMATLFVMLVRQEEYIPDFLGMFVAVTKLIGDCFAWLCYKDISVLVNLLGVFVLALNIIYLFFHTYRFKHYKQSYTS